MKVFHDNYGMETVTLRFGNIYGVGVFSKESTVIPKFVKMGLGGRSLTIYGDGSSTREYVHVDDIVQSIERAISSTGIGGEIYNVGAHSITIREIAEKVSLYIHEANGMKLESINLPERAGEKRGEGKSDDASKDRTGGNGYAERKETWKKEKASTLVVRASRKPLPTAWLSWGKLETRWR